MSYLCILLHILGIYVSTVCLFVCLFVCLLVGWLAGWLAGWLVGWLVGWFVGLFVGISPFFWNSFRGVRNFLWPPDLSHLGWDPSDLWISGVLDEHVLQTHLVHLISC